MGKLENVSETPTLGELVEYINRKPKRNLKNINHWIAELRDLAEKLPIHIESDNGYELATRSDINWIFTKSSMEDLFDQGLTPAEALKEETENWD